MTIKQARAIYYKEQKKKYDNYLKFITENNLLDDFNEFKKNYKGYYKNKVYYYYFRKIKKKLKLSPFSDYIF